MQCSKCRPTFRNFSRNVGKFMWPTRNWLHYVKFRNKVKVAEILANFQNFGDFGFQILDEIDISFVLFWI